MCLAEPRGRVWALLGASRVRYNNVHHGTVTGANSPICPLWRNESAPARLPPPSLPEGTSSLPHLLQTACLLRRSGHHLVHGTCLFESLFALVFSSQNLLTLLFVCEYLCEFANYTCARPPFQISKQAKDYARKGKFMSSYTVFT